MHSCQGGSQVLAGDEDPSRSRGQAVKLQQYVRIPRLFVWVPGQGWRAAQLPEQATEWDAAQWRIQYKAAGLCTLWIKEGSLAA